MHTAVPAIPYIFRFATITKSQTWWPCPPKPSKTRKSLRRRLTGGTANPNPQQPAHRRRVGHRVGGTAISINTSKPQTFRTFQSARRRTHNTANT